MSDRSLGVVMNGVTGRMGYRQHLVRSVLAIREQGGVLLERRYPGPARAGAGRPQRAQAAEIAERHGSTRWTTDLDAALADPTWRSTSTPRSPSARDAALAPAIARRQARLHREAARRDPRRRARAGPGRARRRRQERRRAGQALPARPAQAPAPDRRRLLRPHPVRARRVRLLGVRGRLAGRPAAELELPRRGRRRHRPRHVPALAATCSRTSSAGSQRSAPGPPPTSRSAVDERGAYDATADDAAYAMFELEGGDRSRRSTPPGRCGSTATSWWSSRSTAPTAAPSRACAAAGSSTATAPRSRCGTPTSPAPTRFRAQWHRCRTTSRIRQRLQGAVGAVPPARRRGRALPLRLRRRRARRPARRGGPAVVGARAGGSRFRSSTL